MRITRAYTITREVKAILDKKANKSDYVCRAVQRLHNGEYDFDISALEDREIWMEILFRMELDDPLRPLIKERLKIESTS